MNVIEKTAARFGYWTGVATPALSAPYQVYPLRVTEVASGFHERAEGIRHRPVYRLTWSPSGTRRHTGKYVRLAPERLRLTGEAARRYQEALASPATQETAVFLSTRLGGARIELVLAARRDGAWSVLYRWADTWRGLGISRPELGIGQPERPDTPQH
jgi:hypothetical protein